MGENGTARLLIVDDEEEIRQMLSRHFRFKGYDVETTENGIDALELLSKKRMEVVITDIMMPKMNGIELLEEIRKQYPMIQVIIITGYVTMDNLLAALSHGADTCVFKPLHDLTELEGAVTRAVDHLKIWQQKLKEMHAMKD